MGKNKNVKKKAQKISAPKSNIQELNTSRDGGQIALRGYSYQFLYSCYLILTTVSEEISFQLEGLEDIDCIDCNESFNHITHIQLKYSVNQQDASFLKDVLKNFLEAYLLDQNRDFKIVYDFPVSKGNLSKLLKSDLDDKSRTYWINIISDIRREYPFWNWSAYDFDKFIGKLSFEKIGKDTLEEKIEKALIRTYEITTDNISLFANSIKVLCLEKMEQRAYVTQKELDTCIQSVKIDINKGPQNPAHSWIQKLIYSTPSSDVGSSFYEGKKATPADIVSGLPIRRTILEQEIVDSIYENRVTVIKASSGQGKTTLALQVAYALQKEYTPYQLIWCNEVRELGNIVQYFKTRIKLGEKPLILIDNLDNNLMKWNHLVQLLQSEVFCHYKLLITSREIDWYNYSGDLSNLQSLNIIKPVLNKMEAIEIFNMFKESKRLHSDITNWQKAWNKIAGRQLLIEYVYLLTHGEMLAERIAAQMSEISKTVSGKAKCEILRKICFADICGVKLLVSRLYDCQSEVSEHDFGELLKSMEAEFLVHVDTESSYVEGLHPIRSKHIVDRLHEFFPINNTALSVIKIVKKAEIPVLFSHLPEFNLNENEFFDKVVVALWNEKDLSNYISAIEGLFSGSVMEYYRANKAAFNDADSHGGLLLISTEKCPFTNFNEFKVSIDALDRMREITPQNKNIRYLCELRDCIPACNLHKTYIYTFCDRLYRKLLHSEFAEIYDVESYAIISEWLYNIDSTFNLSRNISLECIWAERDNLSLDCVSTLMYISFCGNNDVYTKFVEVYLKHILTYLKYQTKSHRIYIDIEQKAIYVEYILRLRDIKRGNEESVTRLKYICKTLPIFEWYCADALKPTLNLLSAYAISDDAHKKMPIRNIVIMFRQNLAALWNKTIMSNYEFDTVTEWLEYWFDVRKHVCLLADKCCACIYKILGGRSLGSLAGEVDKLREELSHMTIGEKRYPKEERPFEEKVVIPEGLGKIRNDYFQSILNFFNQFTDFLIKDPKKQQLAFLNLTTAKNNLPQMQQYFAVIIYEYDFQKKHSELCVMENQIIGLLMMSCRYYQTHSMNKYFNKYQIKDWYAEYCQKERKIAEKCLETLKSRYFIHFPDESYNVGMLRYYPIIVDNFNMASESDLYELFTGCISFADTPFDYLVILCTNDSIELNPTSLQVPRQMFIDIQKAIGIDNSVLPDKMLLPYFVDVTVQMLDCFHERYNLPVRSTSDVDLLPIGNIAEELWIYSKLLTLLTEPEDANYLRESLQDIKTNISRVICLLEGKLPIKYISELSDMCNNVFDGRKFDDALYNEFIEKFTYKNL